MKELDEQQKVILDDKIDRFLRGVMTSEEEKLFKAEIAEDEAVRKRAAAHVLLANGVRQYGKQQDLKVIDAVRNSHLHKARRISLWSNKYIPVYAIAACAACFFVNSYMVNNAISDYSESQSNAIMGTMNSNLRGSIGATTYKQLLSLFSNAMDKKDLPKTIKQLQTLYEISRDDNVDDIDDYSSRIGWFLAISYINSGEKDKAKEVLQTVVKDNPNADQAQQLLDKLNKTFFWE